ncbi:MAG TPA: aldo/keto reductase [Vicinamibacterales bacterium]|nr:aldo/keto reductase [Vicinamibacterales bacterium]
MHVSAVSFGAWAIGGFWGPVDDGESMRALHAAIDAGVNFIDTADVYGDGRSERLVAQLKRERPGETIWVTTKAGRRLERQTVEGYSRENLTAWIDRSLANLETETIDLLQLHCPPPGVYDRPEVFGVLDDLVALGKLRHCGVSVETVDEALSAMRYPRVQSVQIIFNMFRLKPADVLFAEATRRHVGIIARVPLASGLLTGKISRETTFADDDHRNFNRHGQMFDVGETFSGVPLDTGFAAVDDLKPLVPPGETLTQFALRWTLMWEAVTCTIPGARTVAQARENAAAADLPALSVKTMSAVERVYDTRVRSFVHARW